MTEKQKRVGYGSTVVVLVVVDVFVSVVVVSVSVVVVRVVFVRVVVRVVDDVDVVVVAVIVEVDVVDVEVSNAKKGTRRSKASARSATLCQGSLLDPPVLTTAAKSPTMRAVMKEMKTPSITQVLRFDNPLTSRPLGTKTFGEPGGPRLGLTGGVCRLTVVYSSRGRGGVMRRSLRAEDDADVVMAVGP
jgi:hypothetical protein